MAGGQVNFSTQHQLEVIEYPGLVIDVDKMLTTLSGIPHISQVFTGEQKRLTLRYHSNNPYSKAAYGDAAPCAGIVLSIKVRRSKRLPSRPPAYQVHIVGYCSRVFTFNSLDDFQYLPLRDDPGTGGKSLTFAIDSLVPRSTSDTEYFTRAQGRPMCIPQIFARTDTTNIGIFRGDAQEDGSNDVLGVLQKGSLDTRDVVAFSMTDPFPESPDTQIVKRMKVKYVSDEQLEQVKKLFEECPIWTRIALLYESGVSHEKLKCITPSLAYYFSSGPWRTLYVRYGYDPRKDFKSRYYQTFDFRLRFRSGMAEFVANRKTQMKKMNQSPDEFHELVQDVYYPYLVDNKLPRSRQCILRYCDIHIAKIQEMLEKIPSPLTGAMCNERTGWLPPGFDAQVRLAVSNAIKELLKRRCRKEQIHAEIDSVEDVEDVIEEDEIEGQDEDESVNDRNFDVNENDFIS